MIPAPHGWARVEHPDTVTFTHPDGPAAGIIRYRERARPWRTFDEIVAATLAELPGIADVACETETFTTREREIAMLARLEATLGGERVRLVIAAVFGDDFYSHLIAHGAQLGDVRELVRCDSHVLGVGRRMVIHPGVPGWTSTRRGLTVDWIDPAREAVIRVFAAEPVDPRALPPIDPRFELVADEDLAITYAELAIASRYRSRDSTTCCDLVVVRDARYEYAAVLESRDEITQSRHRGALHALIRSVVPFATTHDANAAIAAFAHWA